MHPTTRRLFTPGDLRKMRAAGIIAEEERVELIEGEILAIPEAGVNHAAHLSRISAYFRTLLENVRQPYESAKVGVQQPLLIHARLELRPDITLTTPRIFAFPQPKAPKEEVSLLIEVGDESLEYCRAVKLPIYARAAFSEVWLISPGEEVIEVHYFAKPAEGTYEFVERVGRGESFVLQNAPDIEVLVDDLLG